MPFLLPHQKFLEKRNFWKGRRQRLCDYKHDFRHHRVDKPIGKFLRAEETVQKSIIENLDVCLGQIREDLVERRQARQSASDSLAKVRAAPQDTRKVIEQSNFDAVEFHDNIANLDEEIGNLTQQEQACLDKIDLLKDVKYKCENNYLFFYANKRRSEIQESLGLATEDDLNKKVDGSEFEPLLKGLQEAGMEYQADVVAEGITIETTHSHGVESYKNQVAKVLGIELTMQEKAVVKSAKPSIGVFKSAKRIANDFMRGDVMPVEFECNRKKSKTG